MQDRIEPKEFHFSFFVGNYIFIFTKQYILNKYNFFKTCGIKWKYGKHYYGLWQYGWNIFSLLWKLAMSRVEDMELEDGITPPEAKNPLPLLRIKRRFILLIHGRTYEGY